MSDKKATRERVPGLPLVIGVTGHMKLLDSRSHREALENCVTSIFADLTTTYPRTPLVLLSPLAEGADRLVARVALEEGLRLVVPLPMPLELYEADFKTAESKKEFRQLLKRSESFLPLTTACAYGEDKPNKRDEQYEKVGAYIARHCHILIALWDGVPPEKVGGTAQIVQFRLEGVPEPEGAQTTPLDLVASGPLYHVFTQRESITRTAGRPGELRKRYPEGYKDDSAAEAAYHRIYSRTDEFNRDSQRYDTLLARMREQSKAYLFSDDMGTLSAPLKRIMDCYAEADSLARLFQSFTLGVTGILFGLALVGVTFLQAYSDLEWDERSLLTYIIILAVAYFFYDLAKRNEFHSKYLDYRALAEGLRVQFFWRLAGLKEPVADHYLRRQRSELDWIRKAIRVWTLLTEFQEKPCGETASNPNDLRLVLSQWVEDQRSYFKRSLKRDERYLKWLKRGVNVLFVVSLLLSLIQLVAARSNPLIFSMGMLLVIAGLMAAYGERRALAEQIKQYAQMGTIFALARQGLNAQLDAGEHERALELIKELGKEALRENGDWVLLHRERDVEVPNL